MNKFVRKHWKPIVITVCLLIFLTITILLLKNRLYTFDNFIFSGLKKLRCEPLNVIFIIITSFCSTELLLCATIIPLIFSKSKKKAFYIGLNVLLCFLLNSSLKHIFLRPRPLEELRLIPQGGYSFPSGHSMLAVAFYGFFIYLISCKRMKKSKKKLYCGLLSLLILLIGISRIYLGVHFASDVLAGFAISLAYLIIYISIVHKKMER